MPKGGTIAKPIPLLAGAYRSRSLIAGAQRCVNLYPETYQPDSQTPVPTVHFLTPGLLLQSTAPVARPFRILGLYRTTKGELFAVVGGHVYYIDATWTWTAVGMIADSVHPVCMSDNGLALVIVDGSATGYAIDLSTHDFGVIGTGYQAASKVDYIDTYFVFNVLGTNQFYITLSNATYAMLVGGTAFDPLDVAAKTGSPDPIAAVLALNGEIWLIGELTTEVWGNSGAAEFPFERVPSAFIEHGCQAPYSVAKTDVAGYWLMQDRQGKGIIVKTAGYALEQISTYAMEEEIQKYNNPQDAFGYTRQSEGHAFYVITFPTADKTWAMELRTNQPHEWASIDNNGTLHRHRSNCFALAYGQNLVGDYQNHDLYILDASTYTDNGTAIVRIRSFPHLIEAANLVKHIYFIANVGCGQITDGAADPQVSLRWSDDRGATWGDALMRSMGKTGEYNTWPKWDQLGAARDRVYELSWSVDAKTWLGGAFIATKALAQ